jgi:ATP-binding cassette subfamily B protein
VTRSALPDFSPVMWDSSGLGRAVPELLRRAGWRTRAAGIEAPMPQETSDLKHWLDACAARYDAEVESTELRYDRLPGVLIERTPLILRLDDQRLRYLCVLSVSRRTARVLRPTGGVETMRTTVLVEALRASVERSVIEGADRLTEHIPLSDRQRHRLRAAYLRQALGNQVAADGWVIKPAPSAGFWQQLRYAGVLRAAAGFVGSQIVEYGLWIASWSLLGRALLLGSVAPALLTGWALIVTTMLLARLASERLQSELALGIGALIKARLLDGVLHLDPDTTRGQGVGHLLGRTLDSESVESLALSGGFATLAGCLQLVAAMVILVGVETGPWLALEAGVWCTFIAVAIGRLWHRRSRWVDARLELTHGLVESMVGYRTRVTQQPPERWHEGEDDAFAEYLCRSRSMDWMSVVVLSAPRAWLVVSVLTLITRAGSVTSTFAFASAIGSILLAYGAQRQLIAGTSGIIDAAIAWQRVRALFDAARDAATSRSKPANDAPAPRLHESASDRTAVLAAEGVSYRYPRRDRDTLTACSLVIRHGERLLLEGPSGAGKSTLVAVLAGLRSPHAGTLWRERVVLAPQFHDNHVISDTFLFNLLMGRRWPAADDDIAEAEDVCRELGLAPLIRRMPGGLHQPVGDSGWQLSHGERSRLFVARALLQRASVVAFDESFAALDPETLRICLACVWNRAPAAVLVAHP